MLIDQSYIFLMLNETSSYNNELLFIYYPDILVGVVYWTL